MDLYESFTDLLHETPEVEGPLRRFRRAQARKAAQTVVRRKREEELQDAYDAFFAMQSPGRPH